MSEEDGAFWASTIGNTYLSELDRRPKEATNWVDFKRLMIPTAVGGEWVDELELVDEWNALAVEVMGKKLAEVAGDVWY